jgi:uncharacterized membrane protein YqiK
MCVFIELLAGQIVVFEIIGLLVWWWIGGMFILGLGGGNSVFFLRLSSS